MINRNSSKEVHWRVITNFQDLVTIQEKWQDLATTHTDGIFSSPIWLLPWINTYWQKKWQLYVIIGEEKDQLVVFAPFYCQTSSTFPFLKTLYPLGQGEPENAEVASEYQDILISKPTIELYQQLALQIKLLAYDVLNWRAISEKANLLKLSSFLKNYSCELTGKRYLINKNASPTNSLSKSSKYKWKKCQKLLSENKAIFTWVEDNQYIEHWNILAYLHQKRWQSQGKPGAFSDPDFSAFHQRFRTQKTVRMSAISINKKVIAINYYLVFEKNLYFYQSGWDQKFSDYSPGFAMHQWSILNNDFEQYDFMMGDKSNSYKSKYGCNHICNMYNVVQVNSFIRYFFKKISNKLAILLSL